jgi:hypothetical protein
MRTDFNARVHQRKEGFRHKISTLVVIWKYPVCERKCKKDEEIYYGNLLLMERNLQNAEKFKYPICKRQ